MNFSSKTEWNQELDRLKAYFKSTTIPAPGEHQIDSATKIHDLTKAINTFVLRAEENAGNPIFQGTIVGLQDIEKYIRRFNNEPEKQG